MDWIFFFLIYLDLGRIFGAEDNGFFIFKYLEVHCSLQLPEFAFTLETKIMEVVLQLEKTLVQKELGTRKHWSSKLKDWRVVEVL